MEGGKNLKSLVEAEPKGQSRKSSVETKEGRGVKDDSDFELRKMIVP